MFRYLFLVMALSASPIQTKAMTFDVLRTIGSGALSGFIQTDGTVGTLSESNIVDFSLLFQTTLEAHVLSPASGYAVQLQGGSLAASAMALTFDFSQGDTAFRISNDQFNPIGSFYCAQNFKNCSGSEGAGEMLGVFTASGSPPTVQEFESYSDLVVLGTAPVPLPTSILILLPALLVLRKAAKHQYA